MSFPGGFHCSGGLLPSWWRFYCCCNKVSGDNQVFRAHLKVYPCDLTPVSLSGFCCYTLFWSLLQSGPGGGLGAAAGAEGPPRESQCVLGAPWSRHHQPLLGHQHPQSVCGWLWWQGVISACRIFQTKQGNHCMTSDKRPLGTISVLIQCLRCGQMWIIACLCPGSIRHLSCSDRHHGGLQSGSAWVPRWPPVSVFLESLLPMRHGEVRTAASVYTCFSV